MYSPILTIICILIIKSSNGGIVIVSLEEQIRKLQAAEIECYKHILSTANPQNGTYCEATWDGAACWPYTNASETHKIPCPNYLNGFITDKYAYRTCTENGTWFVHPKTKRAWTNYMGCFNLHTDFKPIPDIIKENMPRISLMYNIGYGISLVSLVMATAIMLMFRRLRCHRTTIHVNLFASFILRATISFLKENLLVDGVGFANDVRKTDDGLEFITEGSHWECKLFFCLFYYILGANYMWILVEGLYLHMLVTVTVFSEKSGVKWLIIFGWVSSLAFVVPWAIVRAAVENVFCWNTHPTPGYFWIMRGPIVASVVLNFIIFVNIIRVLFTKLNAFNARETKKFRYKKLAKSTLVLIPLFGVHYVVFIGLPDDVDEKALLVKLYFEMGFSSFQGFIVALIFCFFNGEVQAEIKKKWRRYRLAHGRGVIGRSTRDTMASYVSRGRGGSLASTSNSADSKENPPNGNCVQDLAKYEPVRDDVCNGICKNKIYTKNGHVHRHRSSCDESQPMVSFDVNNSQAIVEEE